MGRRSDHSREELHEMALAAACEIVEEESQSELTVRKVAKRIGYSVGTIYNLFENISELVARINARTLDALYEELAVAPYGDSPEESLQALLTAYLRFARDNPKSWNMLFEDRPSTGYFPPAWYLAKVARNFSLLEERLGPLFGPGRETEQGSAARLLWCGLHGVWTLAAGDKLAIVTSEPVETVAREFVDIFIAGLRAKAG
ncbi:MAG: TetR/AcrR family transcriptional regulator [Alphaproteobacteria bacterium]